MARNTGQRRGIIKFLGNIVDDSKEVVDDILDRARDVEKDLRSTARKALDDDDDDDGDRVPAADIASLQAALAELTAKVNQLAALQEPGEGAGERTQQAEPASAQS